MTLLVVAVDVVGLIGIMLNIAALLISTLVSLMRGPACQPERR